MEPFKTPVESSRAQFGVTLQLFDRHDVGHVTLFVFRTPVDAPATTLHSTDQRVLSLSRVTSRDTERASAQGRQLLAVTSVSGEVLLKVLLSTKK